MRELNDRDWTGVLDSSDPSVAWDVLVENYSMVLDHHAPWKRMYFDTEILVWVTREFLSSCKERDSLKIFCNRTNRPEDIARYNRCRNKHTQFSKNLKRDYFKNAFNEAGQDPKKLWRLVRQLFGNPKNRSKIMKIGNETSDVGITNAINTFFADIGPNLASKIPDSLLTVNMSLMETENYSSLLQCMKVR